MISTPQLPSIAEQFHTEADFCAKHGLELETATRFGWVVRSASGDHFGHVVGCIDQLRDSVELLRLDGGFHWSTFSTLHEALDDLIANPQHDPMENATWRYRLPVWLQTRSVGA